MYETQIGRMVRSRVEQYGTRALLYYRPAGSSDLKTMSWTEFGSDLDRLSVRLMDIDIRPGENVGIFSPNMPEWTLGSLAIVSVRGVTVPLHTVSALQHIEFIVRQTEMRVIFVGEQVQLDTILALLPQLPSIERIIVFDDEVDISSSNIAVHYSAFMKREITDSDSIALKERLEAATEDDLAAILYTSGTTGMPKGTMLSHRNFLGSIRNHEQRVDLNCRDVSLCFLPLSHVFEHAWTYYCLHNGVTIYYLREPRQIIEYLKIARPTVLASVPRIFEKAYDEIHRLQGQAATLKRRLFTWAIELGQMRLSLRLENRPIPPLVALGFPIAEALVFRKIRGIFGGRLKFSPVGGAHLSDKIIRFFMAAGVYINFGYGATETVTTSSCQIPYGYSPGTVGMPMPGTEIRIDVNGEILIKGESVFQGYYKNEEETAARLVDGWYRSGDLGEINDSGELIFLGRLNDIFKTSTNRMVHPGLTEDRLAREELISSAILFGEARKYVSALVVPNMDALETTVSSMGIRYNDIKELLVHPEITRLFEEIIGRSQSGMVDYETIKRFTLLPEDFSIEKGEMTATFKLRRSVISEKYAAVIDSMYA